MTQLSGRTHASALNEFFADRPHSPMGTSTVGFIETTRNMDRIGSFPDLMAYLTRTLTEIILTADIRDRASNLPGTIRTLDAIHIASAQKLGASLEVLVSYDKRMLDVAAAVGLPVAAPGLE
jgi:hypothetical protein